MKKLKEFIKELIGNIFVFLLVILVFYFLLILLYNLYDTLNFSLWF